MSLFQNLQIQAFKAGINPRTKESRDWFRRKAQSLSRINRRELLNDKELSQSGDEIIGSMQMFFYDPKHKDTLPYYDKFPLTIIVGPADKGFYGLNLHYLPPVLRARFLDELLDITNNTKYDDTTKFRASYALLQRAQKFKYFKPCFKHYLTEHVKSRFAKVEPTEWEIATFLPIAQFEKASASKVYSESRKMIR
jgi:hypothetical protein